MSKKNEMLHLLLNKAYNKKYQLINNIKNQDTSQQAKLVTSGALTLGDDIEKTLEAKSLLKDMYRYNNVNLTTKLLDYPQHVVICLLTIVKDYSDCAPNEPDNKGNEKNIMNILLLYKKQTCLSPMNMLITKSITKLIIINNYLKK